MYKLRTKIFLLLVGLVFLVVFIRLADLQLISGERYRGQYEQMLRRVSSLPAVRGRILDRKGHILAMDEPCFDICLEYKFVSRDAKWRDGEIKRLAGERNTTLENAAKIYEQERRNTWKLVYQAACEVRRKELGVEKLNPADLQEVKDDLEKQVKKLVKRITRIRKNVGVPIRMENQPYPMVSALDENMAVKYRSRIEKSLGVSIRPGSVRRYPYRDVACHIIGFTSPVDAEDIQSNNLHKADGHSWFERNKKNYHFNDRIGKAGIEKMCEPLLRGTRGYKLRTKPGQVEKHPSGNGQDVHLTIDINLQRKVTELFAGKQGCAIIMTVPDRQILAMVSVPTYNLNTYRRDYAKLVADGLYLPLKHRAVGRLYPPGSTAKPLAALAGLHYGVISPQTNIPCSGRLIQGINRFRCWNRHGHGTLDLYESIQRSCNIYYYKTGQRIGVAKLSEWYKNFEFDDYPKTGLPEEVKGMLPKVDGREDVAEARLIAIGQGPIAQTPLHVANAIATLAGMGIYRSPMLVLEASALPNPPEFIKRQLPVTPEQIEAVHEGMYKAVNQRGGTLYKVFSQDMPQSVSCGKSGTAQTPPHTCDLNENGTIDPGERLTGDMAWSAAFAPRHNPQIAVVAVVEYTDEHGGTAAGPIVRQCLKLLEQKDQDGFSYLNP